MSNAAEVLDVEVDAETMPAVQKAGSVMTPMAMLDRAIASGQSIEVLTKLMDLHERWEKSNARKAFDEAIAQAKAEIGPVTKNATGHNNKRYANFAAYAQAVDPIIAKFGLSYRFRTEQTDRISVTCILSQRAGHSEENTLSGPPDNTGSKNAIQAIGSTLSYLQRYTLIQALGLAATDDNDAKDFGAGESITDEQAQTIRDLIEQTGTNIETFCKYYKIEAVPELRVKDYAAALANLQKKKAAKS